MTDDQRDDLINELVQKCDEIQEKLNQEIGISTIKAKPLIFLAVRKEQMDIFTHDILKLKGEKEIIQKDSQKKDQVIGDLMENISTLKGRLVELGEKFEACRQAVRL